jgi:hypothetical protein
VLERHLASYLGGYEERFEPRHGPLRSVVQRTAEAYLECGRLQNGFARIRCPKCRGEHLLAFSCRTRNFCPSCQAKRSALLAEHLRFRVLAPVPHRHVVFTIPKALRGLFERERRLLGLLSRCAYETIRRTWSVGFGAPGARPGMVCSIQTFGSYAANFHPHIHALLTDGVATREGEWRRLPHWTPGTLEEVFRRVVVRRLVQAERLSEEFADTLLTWTHTGFSVWGEQVVYPHEGERLERLARYVARPPLAVGLVEETEEGRIRVRTPPDPRTGETEVVLEPVEFVHALARQVPDPGQHLVRYYGLYANRSRRVWQARWRGEAWGEEEPPPADAEADGPGRGGGAGSRTGSWARLLRRVLEVEPLLCPKCGVEMRVVSVLTEPQVVDRILRHVRGGGGHDPFAGRAPPGPEAARSH